ILAAAFLIVGAGVSSVYAFGPGSDFFSEEQKAVFEKIHELRTSGNNSEADAYAEEIGLKEALEEMRGVGMGRGHGKSEEMQAEREAIRTAVENNDYETFKTLTADKPFGLEVTEETFAKMVEMHSLMQAGDEEGAKLLREEIGLRGGERVERGPRNGGTMRNSSGTMKSFQE
ncbi:hypothetical protein KKC45_00775, partial [Patescibacteria group bacterium]|nr:hypothetical protein [Patescibacteria group bacterium]